LVFIAELPTKYALKLASGMFTFCPKQNNGRERRTSSRFFIV